MKKILFTSIFIITAIVSFSQVPNGFNYQAVLRNSSGELISDQSVDVEISIIDEHSGGDILYTETHTKTTNDYGLVNLIIGSETPDYGVFADINWAVNDKFINVKVDATNIGTFQLLTVPFAMHAASATNLGSENVYTGTDTLFVVKDTEGNPVFVVFPDGAKVIVEEATKGTVGGFAVSGRSPTKAEETEIFHVTPDSTRIFVNDTIQSKGSVGGFAVSGRSPTKGITSEYLVVTQDSTRVYISDTTLAKGSVGGFAVSGRSPTKAETKDYFNISGSKEAETIDSEARIFWYPKKEAFLAGRVLVESPDSVGKNSFATGYESKAIGDYSQALGYSAIARGNYSTSIGNNSVAGADSTSINAFAFGNRVYALDTNTIAIGRQAVASSNNALAIGDSAIASGTNAIAFGSSFTDFYFHNGEVGETLNTAGPIASGDNSLAIGSGVVASAEGAVVIGALDTASAGFTTVFGLRNQATAFAAAVGSGEVNRALGKHSIVSGGRNNDTSGDRSTIGGGEGNDATGDNATIAGGTFNNATGNTSAIPGGQGNTASGNNSYASGYYSTASGNYSSTFGAYWSEANDYMETVIGPMAVASTGNQTSWVSTDRLLTIGNGTMSPFVYSNAMVILKNGEVYFPSVYSDEVGASNIELYIDNTGKIGHIASSKRYKREIMDMEDLSWLYELRPVNFVYKNDETNINQYGLIAEEVEGANPLFVSYNKNGEVETVSYNKLITPMLKAIQDQKEKNKEQQTKISELESRLSELEKLILSK